MIDFAAAGITAKGVCAQEFEPHQQASILALAKACTPTEERTTAFGHPEPGVPQVAAFMDTVEPCLHSVYTATTLAAVDALLCWARNTQNEYWCAVLHLERAVCHAQWMRCYAGCATRATNTSALAALLASGWSACYSCVEGGAQCQRGWR